jgi:hypothetical protein
MPTYLAINAVTIGNNIAIPGDPTKPTIDIVELVFQCGTATSVTLKSGSTALTGPMTFPTGGGLQLPNNGQGPHMSCTEGDDFIINISGVTGSCGGFVLFNQY